MDNNKIYENARNNSRQVSAGRRTRKRKSVNYNKIALTLALVAALSTGAAYGISNLSEVIENNALDKTISEEYGSGLSGAVKRTSDNQNYYYDYAIVSNTILSSENAPYVFYNTVNSILSAGLSDSVIRDNFDSLMSNLYSRIDGDIKFIKDADSDVVLIITDSWSSFLEVNHFSGQEVDDIEARELFQKFMRDTYEESEMEALSK